MNKNEWDSLYKKLTDIGRNISELNYHIRGIPAFNSVRNFSTIANQLNIEPVSFVGYRILCLNKDQKVDESQLLEPNQSWSLSPEGCKKMVLSSYSKREKMIIFKALIQGYSLKNMVNEAIAAFESFYSHLPKSFLNGNSELQEVVSLKNHLINFNNQSNSLLNKESEIVAIEIKNLTVYQELSENDF